MKDGSVEVSQSMAKCRLGFAKFCRGDARYRIVWCGFRAAGVGYVDGSGSGWLRPLRNPSQNGLESASSPFWGGSSPESTREQAMNDGG